LISPPWLAPLSQLFPLLKTITFEQYSHPFLYGKEVLDLIIICIENFGTYEDGRPCGGGVYTYLLGYTFLP